MYECGYMYFRFDAAILYFWVISACATINKDLLEFTQQKT